MIRIERYIGSVIIGLVFSILLFGVFVVGMSSCGTSGARLRPFTERFYKDSGLTYDQLKHVQFYIDRDIILYRMIGSNQSTVDQGRIATRGGRKVEEIVIRSGTPGTLVFMPKENRLGISFDADNAGNYLMFGPNPKNNNRYCLLAIEWDRDEGMVSYGPNHWKTPASSAFATLMVNHRNMKKTKYSSPSPEGRVVH